MHKLYPEKLAGNGIHWATHFHNGGTLHTCSSCGGNHPGVRCVYWAGCDGNHPGVRCVHRAGCDGNHPGVRCVHWAGCDVIQDSGNIHKWTTLHPHLSEPLWERKIYFCSDK